MEGNILIIGNGSSLLDRENGWQYDKFDTVVRFNSFKIAGFEKHVGTKTDYWFTVNKYHKKNIKSFKKVFVHSWEHWEDKCEIYLDLSKERDCIKISPEVFNNIPVQAPSTGLIAICYFLNFYNKVYITGFDWWENEKHHYGDQEERGSLHRIQEEYHIIKQLISKGSVIMV